MGGQYYDLYMKASEGSNEFNAIKLPWDVHPEHDDTWFENESKNLTPKQIAQELLCDFAASGDTFLGIDDLDFKWGQQSTSIKHLTFYVAQTTQDAYIPQNPESGIYEHDSAEWVTFETMKAKCYGFLVPVVEWAESIVIK